MEGKLNVIDILTLAKAGYKRKDIEEIIATSNASEEAAAPAAEEPAKSEPQNEQESEPETEDAPDYKQMFEEMQNKFDDLTKKLEAAQKANITADASTTQTKVSTSDSLNNILRDVLS